MSSPYYLLLGGVWVQVPGVGVGAGKTVNRPSSETLSVGGVRRRQRARRAARSWSLTFSAKDPFAVRHLTLAAQGLAGDVFLLDSAAARVNMLDPLDTVGQSAALAMIAVDGYNLRALPTGQTFTIKVRNAISYRFSLVSSAAAGASLGTYQLGAGAATPIPAVAGTGARRTSVTITPSADTDLKFVLTGGSTAARLTEGAPDAGLFLPGQKAVCQVAVDDPNEVLELLVDGQAPLTSYTVSLLEVGT